jgi:beta-ureidopropionase / N-carbamoyl-L-amino-acid hydrolase
MLDPRIRTKVMIFTPCAQGIAHNNNVRAELAYTAPGMNVFLHSAVAGASR